MHAGLLETLCAICTRKERTTEQVLTCGFDDDAKRHTRRDAQQGLDAKKLGNSRDRRNDFPARFIAIGFHINRVVAADIEGLAPP